MKEGIFMMLHIDRLLRCVVKVMVVTGMAISLLACGASDSDDDNDGNNNNGVNVTSTHGETISHNQGQVCQNCHKNGGSGKGVFTVAGSVYENDLTTLYPDTTIHLYTQANGQGTLVASIEVDGLGNFYTTESINLSGGLYPAVTSDNGTNYMSLTDLGTCNSCHDSFMRIVAQ